MPTSFAQAPNNVSAKVGPSGYTAGATTLTLHSGDGAKFPALSGSQWLRVTLVRKTVAYSPAASASSDLTIRKVTAVNGDVLTFAAGTLEGTTDRNYAAGDVVECRVTGGSLSDVHASVNTLETADASNVKTTSSYANPAFLTQIAGSKVSGAIPDASLPTGLAWDGTAGGLSRVGKAVGTGGDRDRWEDDAGFAPVKVDLDGALVRDHTTTQLSQYGFVILGSSLNPPIAISTNSPTNDGTGNGENTVLSIGSNQHKGASQFFDATRASITTNTETWWWNGANHVTENYLHVNKPNGDNTRPWFASVDLDNPDGFFSVFRVAVESFLHTSSDLATSIRTMNRAADGSYGDIVYNNAPADGSDGFPHSFTEDAAKNSRLSIGRESGTSRIDMDGTQCQLVVGPNGQFSVGTGTDVVAFARCGISASNALIALYGTCTSSSQAVVQFDNTQTGTTIYSLSPAGVVSASGGLTLGGGSTLLKILSATATLDFPSTAAGATSDLTITVTGAAVGDASDVELPYLKAPGQDFHWRVTASNTVTIRFINNTASTVDLDSGTARITVFKF